MKIIHFNHDDFGLDSDVRYQRNKSSSSSFGSSLLFGVVQYTILYNLQEC